LRLTRARRTALPTAAVFWSVSGTGQRSQALTTKALIGPISSRLQVSSSYGPSSGPSTTMFGRKRFIGTGSSSNVFSCASERSFASSIELPSANPTWLVACSSW